MLGSSLERTHSSCSTLTNLFLKLLSNCNRCTQTKHVRKAWNSSNNFKTPVPLLESSMTTFTSLRISNQWSSSWAWRTTFWLSANSFLAATIPRQSLKMEWSRLRTQRNRNKMSKKPQRPRYITKILFRSDCCSVRNRRLCPFIILTWTHTSLIALNTKKLWPRTLKQ